MRRIMGLHLAALAAGALCALSSGCFLVPENDESLGRFCAAPANREAGEEYCVGANRSPSAAWSKAKSHGDLPIEMWAEWPDGMTIDELAASGSKLTAWFGNVDRVIEYVRDDERNAESYGATLAGKLEWLLQYASNRQSVLLEQTPVDAAGNFKGAMIDKADAEKSPLLATIATDRQSMAAVQAIFDQARSDMKPLSSEVASAAARFAAYRATEAAETETYAALSAKASASALDALPAVEQAVLAAAREASAAPGDISMAIITLSFELQAFAASFEEAVAPHKEFLATHGAVVPDMTSGAMRSLSAMLGYVQRRVARSDATATMLLQGIALRRRALLALEAEPEARALTARSWQSEAAAAFQGAAEALASALSRTPATSARLKLPYLADRHGELTRVLQMRPLCEVGAASFREAGCAALRGRFDEAEAELTAGLPRQIAAGITTLRSMGAGAALLDAAQAKLDAGDVKGAAIAYDAAVRGMEEGT